VTTLRLLSKRDYTLRLAIWHGKSVSLSVCCLSSDALRSRNSVTVCAIQVFLLYCIALYCLWRAYTLLTGFNFSEIFLHHIVAWPSCNSPTKNHEDRPSGSPPPKRLNRKRSSNRRIWHIAAYSHVWLSHLLMSFLLPIRQRSYVFTLVYLSLC